MTNDELRALLAEWKTMSSNTFSERLMKVDGKTETEELWLSLCEFAYEMGRESGYTMGVEAEAESEYWRD